MVSKILLLALLFLVSMSGTQAQDDTDMVSTSSSDGAESTSSPVLMSTDSGSDDSSSFESSLSESSDESDDSSEDDSESDDDDDDDSDEDSDDDSDSDGAFSSEDDDSESVEDEEDECAQLTQTACLDAESADGDQECGFNSVSGECYSIERSQGSYGTGGFDEGYESAKSQAEAQSQQLQTLVGILGGIIGVLVLVIAGAAYYLWTKQAKADFLMHRAVSMEVETVESEPINETEVNVE